MISTAVACIPAKTPLGYKPSVISPPKAPIANVYAQGSKAADTVIREIHRTYLCSLAMVALNRKDQLTTSSNFLQSSNKEREE